MPEYEQINEALDILVTSPLSVIENEKSEEIETIKENIESLKQRFEVFLNAKYEEYTYLQKTPIFGELDKWVSEIQELAE